MSLCDKAKSILNINQGCAITRSLQNLSASLPVNSDTLNEAIQDVNDALETGPRALRTVNNGIMGGAFGVKNVIHVARELQNLPANVLNSELRGAAQEITNVARGLTGVLNSLNCVSETLTNKAVPGVQRAAACVASGASKLTSIIGKVQHTVNGWNHTINTSINDFLNDIDKRVDDTIKDFVDDNAAAHCLSSMVYIPDDVFKANTQLANDHQAELGDLAKQASGCAGGSRDTSHALRQASGGLSEAAALKLASEQKLAQQVQRIQTALPDNPAHADMVRKAVAGVIKPQENPTDPLVPIDDAMPGVNEAITSAQADVEAAADSMDSAAAKTDIVSVNYTYGHDIIMDRVGNFIRIMHKDGHYTLYNASNIIHAADVTNKHLLWLENAITKFNSHTHLYNPGPGAPTPSRTPIPTFDMSDGTTITKAG